MDLEQENFDDEAFDSPEGQDVSLEEKKLDEFRRVFSELMSGPIYGLDKPPMWRRLVNCELDLRVYLERIGVELVISEKETLAYLRNIENKDDSDSNEFSFFSKKALSKSTSVMTLLCLQRLMESEVKLDPSFRNFTFDEMAQSMVIYEMEDNNNAINTRYQTKIRKSLRELVELGFLKNTDSSRSQFQNFEIREMIKHFADSKAIVEFDKALECYLNDSQEDDDSAPQERGLFDEQDEDTQR